MNMKTKLLLSALTCLASIALFAADSPPVGSAAPDFSVADSKGKAQSVSQYKGKYVVLGWFNPDCPFVKKHYDAVKAMPSSHSNVFAPDLAKDLGVELPEIDLLVLEEIIDSHLALREAAEGLRRAAWGAGKKAAW